MQWPLRDNDDVRIWTSGHELVATLSGRLLRQLVELHLATAALQADVGTQLRRPLALAPARAPHIVASARREAFKRQRRSRKPSP